jgi:phosphoribosyl 1,2-cyclic phosphate phosphodiesterase
MSYPVEITILGSGTSTGVPEAGCTCEVCTSCDAKDKRLRASALVDVGDTRLLIDCGPDFRQQIMPYAHRNINAILLTHEHYDHLAGLDDIRPFCKNGPAQVFGNIFVLNALQKRMPYFFARKRYPGVPAVCLHRVDSGRRFRVADVQIMPIMVLHHHTPILGFRIGNFAYLTDLKYLPESEYPRLEGLDLLVMNALRREEHLTHQNLEQALHLVERIAPRRTYLTHIAHQMGKHSDVEAELPANVSLAYDGLRLTV